MVLVEGVFEPEDWENDERERQVDANFANEGKEENSINSNPDLPSLNIQSTQETIN